MPKPKVHHWNGPTNRAFRASRIDLSHECDPICYEQKIRATLRMKVYDSYLKKGRDYLKDHRAVSG